MKRIAFNATSQLVAFVVALGLQTIYMIVVARVLGPGDFGRYAFAWSIIQILLIGGDLGLHNAALRQVSSRPEEAEDYSFGFFWMKLWLHLIQLLLILAAALAGGWAEAPTRHVFALFGVGMFLHSLALGLNVLFQARGRLYWASLNICLIFGIQFLLGSTALLLGGGLQAVALAYLGAALLGLLSNLFLYRYMGYPIRLSRPKNWRHSVRDSLPVGLGNLFQVASSRISVSLVTLLAGAFATGVFAAAHRMVMATSNAPQGILNAVIPALAAHQERPERLRRLVYRALLLVLLLAVVTASLFYWFAEPLILLVFGIQYESSVDVLRQLSPLLVPLFAGLVFYHVVLSQNLLVGWVPWISGAALLLNLVLCYWLIPRYGAVGAAWAVLTSESCTAFGYAAVALRFLHREGGEEG